MSTPRIPATFLLLLTLSAAMNACAAAADDPIERELVEDVDADELDSDLVAPADDDDRGADLDLALDRTPTCVDDVYEGIHGNDIFGDAAPMPDKFGIDAVSCGAGDDADEDWYDLGLYRPGRAVEVTLRQQVGSRVAAFADLDMAVYCGPAICTWNDERDEITSIAMDDCAHCPAAHPLVLVVYPDAPDNPPTGTPYGLAVR